MTALFGHTPLWRYAYSSRPALEEAAYRDHYLEDDIKQVATIISIAIGLMVALTLIDVFHLGVSKAFTNGMSLRMFMISTGAVLVFWMKRVGTARALDITALLYTIIIAFSLLIFHIIREPGIVRIAVVVTLVIFAFPVAFPTYPVYTFIPVLLLLAGDGYLIFSSGRAEFTEHAAVVMAVFVAAEIIAGMGSAHLQRSRHHAFEAISKVKTLSGMLPICANCKNIRNDEGFYQQIEDYIEAHSNAAFTHGICPDCLIKLYPELQMSDQAGGEAS